jgi:hypothetical protein
LGSTATPAAVLVDGALVEGALVEAVDETLDEVAVEAADDAVGEAAGFELAQALTSRTRTMGTADRVRFRRIVGSFVRGHNRPSTVRTDRRGAAQVGSSRRQEVSQKACAVGA